MDFLGETGGITKGYKWFSPTVADTYEYTNIAITAPPLSYVRISVSQGWYNGAPTGILVSTAATASEISIYNTLNKVEQQEGSLTRKLLDLTLFTFNSSTNTTDTYYIYEKKLSANQANPLSYCVEFL